MAYEYSKKIWHVVFYTEIVNGKIVEDNDGNPLVNIKCNPQPQKIINYAKGASGNRLMVLLIKPTTQSKFSNLKKELEEVHHHGYQYQLEPLLPMIHRHAKETGFEPFKVGEDKKSREQQSPRLVEASTPLTDLLFDS